VPRAARRGKADGRRRSDVCPQPHLGDFFSLNPYNRCSLVALAAFSTDDEGRARLA